MRSRSIMLGTDCIRMFLCWKFLMSHVFENLELSSRKSMYNNAPLNYISKVNYNFGNENTFESCKLDTKVSYTTKVSTNKNKILQILLAPMYLLDPYV